ncbi:hypothetical protein QQF64_006613 [Cirrhinus molitorella]|uniref:Cyclic nucleotide-gated channel C-terminal leucine zipper domain-containing protein n=1 Tax=Cirrhinus molitorella TaxID=172907 RepID=A0ABR3MCF8_9TELE
MISLYPDAKKALEERGRQILLKEGLLEELDAGGMGEERVEEKVERLEASLEILQTRFARLLAEYTATQQRLKQRLTALECRTRHSGSGFLSDGNESTVDGDGTHSEVNIQL